jgi:hypothetical protein
MRSGVVERQAQSVTTPLKAGPYCLFTLHIYPECNIVILFIFFDEAQNKLCFPRAFRAHHGNSMCQSDIILHSP